MMVLFPRIKGKRSENFERGMGYSSLAVVLCSYVFVLFFMKVYWKCVHEWIYLDIHYLMLVEYCPNFLYFLVSLK